METQDGFVKTQAQDGLVKTQESQEDFSGKLEVMGRPGHTDVCWSSKNPDDVAAAEATFNALIAKGYLAFKRKWLGRKGAEVSAFNAKDGAYVFDKAPGPDPQTLASTPDKAADQPHPADHEKSHKRHEYEQTREFDKKAETIMTPPYQGG